MDWQALFTNPAFLVFVLFLVAFIVFRKELAEFIRKLFKADVSVGSKDGVKVGLEGPPPTPPSPRQFGIELEEVESEEGRIIVEEKRRDGGVKGRGLRGKKGVSITDEDSNAAAPKA